MLLKKLYSLKLIQYTYVKSFVNVQKYSLIRLFRVHLSLIWDEFECTRFGPEANTNAREAYESWIEKHIRCYFRPRGSLFRGEFRARFESTWSFEQKLMITGRFSMGRFDQREFRSAPQFG